MKLMSYWQDGQVRLGAVLAGGVVDMAQGGFAGEMKAFIAAGPQVWQQADAWLRSGAAAYVDGSPRPATPLANPGKVIAIGLNYMDHCREQNVRPPERPMVFAKFPTAVIGPGEEICWDTALTGQVDFEAELGVVIGRTARRVDEAQALEYVFGYTVINDVSARDLQFGDKQWVRGKSLDTFCPVGPLVVSADEIPDPQALGIRCRVNGVLMQNSSTAEMIFGVRTLVAFLSQAFTLQPGDLIATGTPDGVGVFRKPPVFLQDGDQVVCEIDGIGALENRARVWTPG